MKIKKFIPAVFFMGLIVNFALSPCLDAQEKEEKKEEESQVIIIPKEVKSVLQEGKRTGQKRLDIPFTIIKHLYFPAQQNVHSTFLFKVKNADLGFNPLTQPSESPEEEAAPTKLQANAHIFLQFNHLENNKPGELAKEVYIPVKLQIESTSYDPDKEELYTTGYPLPPGKYLLSMAITSSALEKIGTQYFEFSLPDPGSYINKIETTPMFFVKGIKRMATPETRAEVHKDFFSYSILQIEPNIDNVFSPGENLDVFFFVYGAQNIEGGKVNIEVNYQVLQEGEKIIQYAPGTYEAPIISQPLPMKKTVITKSETEGEKKELQDLEAGKYTLSLTITDKSTGNSTEKTLDFEVK